MIGQYSFIEEEISTFGFKAASHEGALVAIFKLEDFNGLAKFNQELRDLREDLLEQKHSNVHHNVDFVRVNPNSELEQFPHQVNKQKVLRAIKRLRLCIRVWGSINPEKPFEKVESYQIFSNISEVKIGDITYEEVWYGEAIEQLNLEKMIPTAWLKTTQSRIMHVKDSLELHREIWDLALVEIQDLPWD